MVNIYLCAYCSLCATASASVSTRIGTCSSFVLAFSLWFCQTLTHSHASRPGWVGGARIETLERAHFTSLFLRGCGAEDDSVACACLPAPHHVVGTCNHIENQTKSKKLAFSGMATRDSAGMNDAGATVTARWDPKTGYRNRKYDARDICVCVLRIYTHFRLFADYMWPMRVARVDWIDVKCEWMARRHTLFAPCLVLLCRARTTAQPPTHSVSDSAKQRKTCSGGGWDWTGWWRVHYNRWRNFNIGFDLFLLAGANSIDICVTKLLYRNLPTTTTSVAVALVLPPRLTEDFAADWLGHHNNSGQTHTNAHAIIDELEMVWYNFSRIKHTYLLFAQHSCMLCPFNLSRRKTLQTTNELSEAHKCSIARHLCNLFFLCLFACLFSSNWRLLWVLSHRFLPNQNPRHRST